MPCGGAQLCKVLAPALQPADRYGRQMRLCQMPVAALTGPWFVYCGYSSVEARAQDRRRRVYPVCATSSGTYKRGFCDAGAEATRDTDGVWVLRSS